LTQTKPQSAIFNRQSKFGVLHEVQLSLSAPGVIEPPSAFGFGAPPFPTRHVVVLAKPDCVSAKPDSVLAKPDFDLDSADRASH
jgi:hypothetical protein